MRILIAGSHGLIGSHLFDRLVEEGEEPIRLVRYEEESGIRWDSRRGAVDPKELEGFDAVINLGGAPIGERRWTEREKAKLWDSRVVSTEILARSFDSLLNKPKIFISASAVGYYGDQGDTELTEDSPKGDGFFAELCAEWEASAAPAAEIGMRVVNVRTGVVFSDQGGLLKRQLPLFKLGIAGRLGDGRQWMSWVDIDDEVDAIIFALRNESISGPINVTSPVALQNEDFTKLFASILRRPAFVPAPRWMISLALGSQITDEMLLASQRVVPQKLLDAGFEFQYPDPAESIVRLFKPDELEEFRREVYGEEPVGRPPVAGEAPTLEQSSPRENGNHPDVPDGS